jgi:hypothetical protein
LPLSPRTAPTISAQRSSTSLRDIAPVVQASDSLPQVAEQREHLASDW